MDENTKSAPMESGDNRASAIPEQVTSPLGVDSGDPTSADILQNLSEDGAAPVTAAPEVSDAQANTPTPAPSGESSAPGENPSGTEESPGEDLSLQEEKARSYDFLMSDPHLNEIVTNHVAQRMGQVPPQTPQQQPQADEGFVSKAEYDALAKQVQAVVQSTAAERLQQFAREHSDFDKYKDLAGQYVVRHGLPLKEAYLLAKSLNGGTQLTGGGKSAVPPAEAGPGGGGKRVAKTNNSEEAIIREAQEQIAALPQTPRRFEDAVNLAISAAMKAQGLQ
jgi:hypothetical protein